MRGRGENRLPVTAGFCGAERVAKGALRPGLGAAVALRWDEHKSGSSGVIPLPRMQTGI